LRKQVLAVSCGKGGFKSPGGKQMVKYEIDPAHTTVGFSAKHLAVSTVHGQFNKFEGTFEGPEGQD
jgi:polyisoprenoid-binding protein YceI